MKNFRKNVLFFFGIILLTAFSVSVHAATVEEQKVAMNYNETLPTAAETRPVEETAPVGGVSAVAVASQAVVAAAPEVQPSGAASEAVTKDLPGEEALAVSNPSGLIEVDGYKYPVYLFVPKNYRTDRTYAMVMIAPAESAKAEQQIEYLTGLAQRKSIFVLAPYVLWPKEGDTPYNLDQWLLTVKKDVMERFPISKKRVYLIGKGLGGHYAAYLATRYPQEFTAAALLGEAWDGPFYQLIRPRPDAAGQVPFYVALKADGDARARNQAWFDTFQKKGYPLHLADYKTDEELDDLEFKKSVFDWLETTGQSWEASLAQAPKTWKSKFKKGVKDFFAV